MTSTVAEHMATSRPGGMPVATWLVLGAGALTATVAIASLAGLSDAKGDIRDLRQRTAQNQEAAQKLGAGLTEANRRLAEVGEAPVMVPSVPPVVGPAGPAGAAGAPGSAGSPGAPGAAGPAGAAGAQGPPGPTGAPGAAGPPGAEGSQGPAGASGADGAAGAAGADGQPGPAGADGAAGQPPVSWTFAIGPITYTCTRTDPFDPASPTYQCAGDRPGEGS